MTKLIFKNSKLQGILKISQQATIFKATFGEAITAYQEKTGRKYTHGVNLEKYNTRSTPTLWLVKDTGICLVTSAILDQLPADKSHVCYAEGFEPDNPHCFQKSNDAVGADDFCASFSFTRQYINAIKKGADLHISLERDFFRVKPVYPNKK